MNHRSIRLKGDELVSHLAYVAVLGFILIGTGWLEVVLRTRVYSKWRRLLLSVVPVVIVFSLWDLYAIAANHWTFDWSHVTGVVFVGGLPLDEVLFFIVVPLAAILTLEAVRSVKRWPIGDEPEGQIRDGHRAGES
jgi:lycopene cyclase domain-containing protein